MDTKQAIKRQINRKDTGKTDYPIIQLAKGMTVAYGITCIFFIAYGILITYTNMSFDNLPIVALVTTAISTVVAGYDWAVCTKGKGLIVGALAGIVYTVLLFCITFLANNSFNWGFSKIVTFLVAVIAGSIGGIFGANRR